MLHSYLTRNGYIKVQMIFFSILLQVQFPPIGSHPDSWNKYKENIDQEKLTFRCFDNSKIISLDKINDNYLDCPDGSDEPGTDAYQNGTFYCNNSGILPMSIPKWSVGDGICDCCDGLDEYFMKSKWNCPNTCQSLLEKRNKLAETIRMKILKGLQIKADLKLRGEKLKLSLQKRYTFFKRPLDFLAFLITKAEELNQYEVDTKSFDHKFYSIITKIWTKTFSPSENRKNIFPPLSTALSKDLNRLKTFIISHFQLELANLSEIVVPEALPLYNEEYTHSEYTLRFLRDIRQPHNLVGLFQKISNDTMYFDHGDHCWKTNRGRNIELQLICHDKNGLVRVEEPETCVYRGVFASPIGCSEGDLKYLEESNTTELEELVSLLDF